MSCDVGHGLSLDPTLLWLWCRPAAAAPTGPLAWELSYATGMGIKSKKRKEKKSCSQYSLIILLMAITCEVKTSLLFLVLVMYVASFFSWLVKLVFTNFVDLFKKSTLKLYLLYFFSFSILLISALIFIIIFFPFYWEQLLILKWERNSRDEKQRVIIKAKRKFLCWPRLERF